MKKEIIYSTSTTKVQAEGGLVHITKKYIMHGIEMYCDCVTLTASEFSEIVKAWDNLGEIEF